MALQFRGLAPIATRWYFRYPHHIQKRRCARRHPRRRLRNQRQRQRRINRCRLPRLKIGKSLHIPSNRFRLWAALETAKEGRAGRLAKKETERSPSVQRCPVNARRRTMWIRDKIAVRWPRFELGPVRWRLALLKDVRHFPRNLRSQVARHLRVLKFIQ